MTDKNGNLTINYDVWKNGIGQHPTVGMGDIVNVDIFSKPGVAMIDYAPTTVLNSDDPTDTDTLFFGTCSIRSNGDAIIGSEEGDVFILDKSDSSVTEQQTASGGDYNNSVFWKSHTIFVDYNQGTDTISLTAYRQGSGGDDLDTDFVSGNSGEATDNHNGRTNRNFPIVVGADDVVYVGYGNKVASLTEDAGQDFDPGDSNTYTWNPEALDIPEDYVVDGLENLGQYLIVSASGSKTKESALFPWDRVSVSYNFPTIINNGVVAQVKSLNNLLYVLSGEKGQVLLSNLSITNPLVKFENLEFPSQALGIEQQSEAVDVVDDTVIFGVSNDNASTNFVSPVGVYKVKGNAYTRNILSDDKDGTDAKITIHFVQGFKYSNFLVGWQDLTNSDYGVDEFGYNDYRYTGYRAKLESPLATVGGAHNKKSYQEIEVKLAKELATGEGIRISYRENLTDSWTTIATFDYATYGAEAEFNTTAKIIDVTTVQIRVELTTGSSSTTTPELISVNIF